MIGIFISADDSYLTRVIDYLLLYQCPFKIIHLDEIKKLDCTISFRDNQPEIELFIQNGEKVNFKDFSFFFFRSGKFKLDEIEVGEVDFDHEIAEAYLDLEKNTLVDYIYSIIAEKSIGYLQRHLLNKLTQLKYAQEVKLKIPDTIVTSNRESLLSQKNKSNFITKAIQENIAFQDEKKVVYQRVSEVNLTELSPTFFPSLFQEKLEKEMEIRSFYLDGDFFSIGFYCPYKTVDSRSNYDDMVYFKVMLPNYIIIKLKSLMEKLSLLAGSIDLIYDVQGEYNFLEVNPEGQYDWVSKFGGYNLDKVIAQFLSKKEKEYERR